MWKFLTNVTPLVVVTVVVACGSGSTTSSRTESPIDGATASPVKDESEFARSMLLTVADFPSGWAEKTRTKSGDNPFDKCAPPTAGKVGDGESGDFSKGGATSISEKIAVFANSDDAAAALGNIESRAGCAVKLINDGNADTAEAHFSAASFSPLSFPSRGDQSLAFRLELKAQAKGKTGIGSEARAYFDVVYVVSGRVGYSIEADDVLTPADSALLQQFVDKAAIKIRQQPQ